MNATNPYETSYIGKPIPKSNFTWPLPNDARYAFQVLINQQELEKCIRDDHFTVRDYRTVFVFSLFGSIVFAFFTWTASPWSRLEFTFPFFMFLSLIGGIGSYRKMFYAWHVSKAMRTNPWMWGNVSVQIDEQGIQWRSETYSTHLNWEGLSEISLGNHCIWITSNAPLAVRFPLYRDWVDLDVWDCFLRIAEIHPRHVNRMKSFRLQGQRVAPMRFDGLDPPDIPMMVAGQIPFQTPEYRTSYGAERTTTWITRLIFVPVQLWFFGVIFLPMCRQALPDFLKPFVDFLDAQKDTSTMYFGPWIVLMSVWRVLIAQLPIGPHIFQQSQPFISSQAGYISERELLLSTPYGSAIAQREIIDSVSIHAQYAVVKLQPSQKGHSWVLPKEQFKEDQAEQAWEILEKWAQRD